VKSLLEKKTAKNIVPGTATTKPREEIVIAASVVPSLSRQGNFDVLCRGTSKQLMRTNTHMAMPKVTAANKAPNAKNTIFAVSASMSAMAGSIGFWNKKMDYFPPKNIAS
jgi:hypothetical protein